MLQAQAVILDLQEFLIESKQFAGLLAALGGKLLFSVGKNLLPMEHRTLAREFFHSSISYHRQHPTKRPPLTVQTRGFRACLRVPDNINRTSLVAPTSIAASS